MGPSKASRLVPLLRLYRALRRGDRCHGCGAGAHAISHNPGCIIRAAYREVFDRGTPGDLQALHR